MDNPSFMCDWEAMASIEYRNMEMYVGSHVNWALKLFNVKES
jgi:hypothetical protein